MLETIYTLNALDRGQMSILNTCWFAFLVFLYSVSSSATSDSCMQFYEGRKVQSLTNKETLALIQNPLSQDYKDWPALINSYFNFELKGKENGLNSLLVTESVSVRGLREITYDYGPFQVEIIRPLVSQKDNISPVKPVSDQELSQIISQLKAKHGKTGSENLVVGSGRTEYVIKILEQLNFVFDRYISEKGWPPSFLKKLLDVAISYGAQSTYVVVRETGHSGQKGRILGSIRLISTPYADVSDLQSLGLNKALLSELAEIKLEVGGKNWLPSFQFPIEGPGKPSFIDKIPNWKSETWKHILDGNEMHVPASVVWANEVVLENRLSIVPSPFEKVLGKLYTRERESDLKNSASIEKLSYFVEPGNFAIVPDHDLPKGLRGIAPTVLYFHIARLIRKEAGAHGPTTRIGTYASEGSSSDRFYQSLGFKLHEVVTANQQGSNNPTNENWNVLMGDGNTLNTALLKRFRLRMGKEELDAHFRKFDEYERMVNETSFFEKVSQSLRGLVK